MPAGGAEDVPLSEAAAEAVGELLEARAFIGEHGLLAWMRIYGEPDPWMLEALTALDAAVQEVWREARRRKAVEVARGTEATQHHRRGG